ncbi:MAG: ExeM/NucH family extracellular endonuclease, partial [Actinobacteria bacterium]|nr:ExeM/NucH family extracellular endonuclease [Actinomycetota bacterium]
MFTHASRRSGVIASALLGLVAAPLVVLSAPAAQANPAGTGVVISEVYGGGGNSGGAFRSDFVELYNPTGEAIDLTDPQLSIQYRSASSGNPGGSPVALTGSIAPGGHYLIKAADGSDGTQPALPTPDATTTFTMGGTSGQVLLINGTDSFTTLGDLAGNAGLVDMVGYGSQGAGASFETSAASAPANATSVARNAQGADTDDNSADFTVGAPTPTNTTAGDAPLSATDPGAQTAIVDTPVTPFTLEATGGTTPYTWEATGLPDGLALSTEGEVTGTPTVVDSYSVEATVADAATPAAEDSVTFDFTITEPGEVVLISEIQGDGAESPLVDSTVTVEAVVTSVITASDVTDGFFLQEEDADADADPATSEGVYVFCRNSCPADLSAGDQLRVTGDVAEFNTTTQIDAAFGDGTFELLGSDAPLPTAAVVSLPAAASTLDAATFEDVEGMRTTISTTLAVSEYFNQARYGEIVLTAGERPYQFTQTNEPSVAGYDAFLADLATRRIVLDDDSNSQNAATSGPQDNEPYYYPTPGLSTGNSFRGGDTVTDLTGVFEYSFGAWKLRPVEGEDYTFEPTNPRPASPDEVGGRLKVASFNVLNYFATIDETSSSSSGPCGPAGTDDCRGADSDQERERQLAKIVDALVTIDADVFGLIEIQNDTGLATEQIVDALNTATAPGTYDYIDTGFIGTGAIKQAFLYKTSTVTPVGEYETLTSAEDPLFVDTLNRPALIQTFDEVATGERVTVAVNHLKSKGSGCGAGDDSPEDGSGNCDGTRTAAAQALADYLATDPTESGDPDFLVIGDLNSYSQERPISTLEDNDYVDLLERFEGMESYGYLFDGQLGHLDQALATATLDDQVTGAGGWKINADENPLLDYNDTVADAGEASFERESSAETLFEPNAYRSSDHDPVVVGLDLGSDTGDSVDVQILATNDFHGRIANDPFSSAAGAGVLAG